MNSNISPDAVRALAYQLWMDRGCNGGSPEDDWFRAEEILSEEHQAALREPAKEPPRVATERIDKAVEESFPASDPPAVHLKDEPPVNAGEKWKAADKEKERSGRTGRGRRNGGATP